MQSIVSSSQGKSVEELENTIGRAKAFYFSRQTIDTLCTLISLLTFFRRTTGHTVTWEDYLQWAKSYPSGLELPSTPQQPPGSGSINLANSNEQETPDSERVLSFQEITELIRTGQTHLIPNNKLIPDALNVRLIFSPEILFAENFIQSAEPSTSTAPTRKKPWEIHTDVPPSVPSTGTTGPAESSLS